MGHNTVVIKSNRAGMSVYLDPMVPFEQLLEDVAKKFRGKRQILGFRPDDPFPRGPAPFAGTGV